MELAAVARLEVVDDDDVSMHSSMCHLSCRTVSCTYIAYRKALMN
jgi:hypothetical protein